MPDNKKELMMYRMSGAKEQYENADEFVKVVEAYLESERLGQ